jgi:hypothetical protein
MLNPESAEPAETAEQLFPKQTLHSPRPLRSPHRRRAGSLSIVVIVMAAALACGGDPPEKEMQQAQGAIDAARAAGADQYAREEFTAAQDALTHANQAVADRDYRQALNYALDSRERAQNAAAMAADGKAAARVDADRAISAATAAVNELTLKLKSPDAARLPARTLAGSRKALADGQGALQEARAAFQKADYLSARSKAAAATTPLSKAAKDLDAAMSAGARRRR